MINNNINVLLYLYYIIIIYDVRAHTTRCAPVIARFLQPRLCPRLAARLRAQRTRRGH